MSPKSKGRRQKHKQSASRRQQVPRGRESRRWMAPMLAVGAIVVAVGLIIVVATRPSTKRAARRADAVSAGRQVYVAKCAICHGREGDGSSMGPPMFSGELASLPDSSYRQAIANGVSNRRPQYGPMPPQKLSASDTDKVISYIRSAQAGPR